MNIAIFGASGATGKLLTTRCLAAQHNVTALVRTPENFPLRDQVHIIQGSAFDPDLVLETIKGADVVLSALGPRSPLRNENILPRAVPNIVEAMQQSEVRRIIVLGSASARADAMAKQPALRRWFIENIVFKTFLKWPTVEQVAQYNILSSTNLDWTMVMPPRLLNVPAHGTFRIDGDALPRNGSSISREDVADFMIQQITNPQWIKKGVYIVW